MYQPFAEAGCTVGCHTCLLTVCLSGCVSIWQIRQLFKTIKAKVCKLLCWWWCDWVDGMRRNAQFIETHPCSACRPMMPSAVLFRVVDQELGHDAFS